MTTYRLFIAAELPPTVRAEVARAQEQLRRGNPPVKWVAPTAIHLTLRFLGETDVALLPALGTALRTALAGHPRMMLQFTSAGAFPNMRRPSVVWAGIGGSMAAIERAAAAIETQVAALGFPRESRPFRAHLTLGRVRREATPAQLERLGEAIRSLPPLAPAAWMVERVVLFRSELRSSGPVYTELDSVPLA